MFDDETFQKIKKNKRKPWKYEQSRKEMKKRVKKSKKQYKIENESNLRNEFTH
jgi:hypothetical protein